ncbi:MAG: hypothetical protein AAF727_08830 [Pseudomonadota bacterium]
MRGLVAFLILMAVPAWAGDFIEVPEGPLSDNDFYRLVACTARPGGKCTDRIVKWPRRVATDLSVGIVEIADGYPRRLHAPIRRAIDAASAEISAAGARISMRVARTGETPDIAIYLVAEREFDTLDDRIAR